MWIRKSKRESVSEREERENREREQRERNLIVVLFLRGSSSQIA